VAMYGHKGTDFHESPCSELASILAKMVSIFLAVITFFLTFRRSRVC
jgi:hypothetical protein